MALPSAKYIRCFEASQRNRCIPMSSDKAGKFDRENLSQQGNTAISNAENVELQAGLGIPTARLLLAVFTALS